MEAVPLRVVPAGGQGRGINQGDAVPGDGLKASYGRGDGPSPGSVPGPGQSPYELHYLLQIASGAEDSLDPHPLQLLGIGGR